LPQIEIGLAGGGNAKPRRLAVEHDAVELVGAREGGNGIHLRPCSRRSWSSGGSGHLIFNPPGGISKSVGSTTCTRDGSL